jgi:TusA-related sulfurtransferase
MGQRRRRPGGEGDGGGLSAVPGRDNPHVLDLSEAEQYCSEPSPLQQVRRAFGALEPGAVLEVRSRVAEHAFAVRVWARREGVEVLRDEQQHGVHVVVVRR